jgi:hypothetical protein
VHSAVSIVVFAVADAKLGVVLAGVALVLIISVVFLLTGGNASAYDRIGAGGMSREGEHADAPATSTAQAPATQAEREREIRQMLSARSERLVRSGRPGIDIDAELARLLAGEPRTGTHDADLRAEVRQLVTARNERRMRQGMQPLDVDAEVARALEELEP